MAQIELVRGDITGERVDVIVTAANAELAGGGGVDGAIHAAAGPGLMAECRAIGGCATGDAVITGAGDLGARHVIHAVGPIWRGGEGDEDALLARCHRRCIELAAAHDCRSIAFPAISTGVYGFPVERAAPIALNAVGDAASRAAVVELIRFVLFSDGHERVFRDALERLPRGYAG